MKVGARTVCNGEGFKCLPTAVSLIKPAARSEAGRMLSSMLHQHRPLALLAHAQR